VASGRHGEAKINSCRITGAKFSNADMARAIAEWAEKHVGTALDVTCIKDLRMIELWDDRCIQVEPNTGRTVFDEFEAEAIALSGKP
jgi:putative heme iron utilization protein